MTPRHWPLAALFALLLPLCPAWTDSGLHQLAPNQPGISG